MKKAFCTGTLAVSLLLGAARAARAAAGCGRVDERREFCVCAAGLLQ